MVFLIISINFFGICDAPPIKKPSMLGIFFNILTLLALTDPPYRILGYLFINLLLNYLFIFIFGMGHVGLALATTCAALIVWLLSIIFLIYLRKSLA